MTRLDIDTEDHAAPGDLEPSDDPPMGKRLRMATPTRTEDRLTPQAADWYALPVSLLPKPTRRSM